MGLAVICSFCWILFIICILESNIGIKYNLIIRFFHEYIWIFLSMVYFVFGGLWFWSPESSNFFLNHHWILNLFNFAYTRRWGLLVRWFFLKIFVYWYLSQFILQCLFAWTLCLCDYFFFIAPIELDFLMFEFFLVGIKVLIFSLERRIDGIWLLVGLIILILNINIVLHTLL